MQGRLARWHWAAKSRDSHREVRGGHCCKTARLLEGRLGNSFSILTRIGSPVVHTGSGIMKHCLASSDVFCVRPHHSQIISKLRKAHQGGFRHAALDQVSAAAVAEVIEPRRFKSL